MANTGCHCFELFFNYAVAFQTVVFDAEQLKLCQYANQTL